MIIIPKLKLNFIPYVLVGNTSASNSLADYPLLKSFIISLAPSFLALSPTWMKSESPLREPERNGCSQALLIGDPESNLPAAEDEVSLVEQSLARVNELSVLSPTKNLATKHTVLESLVQSSVVHFSSHGNFKTSDELHLRAGAIRLADGTLFANDIEV